MELPEAEDRTPQEQHQAQPNVTAPVCAAYCLVSGRSQSSPSLTGGIVCVAMSDIVRFSGTLCVKAPRSGWLVIAHMTRWP